MDKQLVKRLRDDPYFKEFTNFVLSKIEEFDSVSGLVHLNNKDAGELARIRAISIKMIEEIFSPFINFNEKREPTKDEIDAVKKSVGL